MNENQKYETKVKPISYIGYLKRNKNKRKGEKIIFYCNLRKIFVSDNLCPWQIFCRKYQKLAF